MPYLTITMRSSLVFRVLSLSALGPLAAATPLTVARAESLQPPAASAAGPATPAAPAPSSAAEGPTGELNARISDEQGTLFLDGREVGQGSFRGTVPAGRHQLRVTRPGYEPYEVWVDVEPGQVRTESISLRQSVAEVVPRGTAPEAGGLDGLYGGIVLFGAFQPSGAGTTFEDACDTTGATSCSPESAVGAGLSGYIGWLFDPLGLELGLMGSAHAEQPSASFDGVHGSDINPIVATPAREEKFTIGRFGGGATLRGRLWYSLPSVRFTVAAGPGLAFRTLVYERETDTPDGFSGRVADSGISYFSPMLWIEGGAQLMLGKNLGLSIGFVTWFENASDNGKSSARTDTVLFRDEDTPPLQQATPAYDLANGPQWFLGPYLGLSFGP